MIPPVSVRKAHPSFLQEVWHLVQISVPLYFFYRMIAHVVGGVLALADKSHQVATGAAAVAPFVVVEIPEPIVAVIISCAVTAVIGWELLKYACEQEWVQEPVDVRECWHEWEWLNPWTWVKVLVCSVKEVLKWVLKEFCKYRIIVTVTFFVVCSIVGIALVL
jgi:hypothetical protein